MRVSGGVKVHDLALQGILSDFHRELDRVRRRRQYANLEGR